MSLLGAILTALTVINVMIAGVVVYYLLIGRKADDTDTTDR